MAHETKSTTIQTFRFWQTNNRGMTEGDNAASVSMSFERGARPDCSHG